MRRVSQLITSVRRETENESTSSSDGISDEDIIEYLNDGQRDLYRKILEKYPEAFHKEAFIDTVRNQEKYTLPSDLYLRNRTVTVEYTHTGTAQDYRPLRKLKDRERNSIIGRPNGYILQSVNQLILSPIPSSAITNGIRLIYDPLLARLDKRRTTVDSVTVSSGVITALTLITTTPFDQADYSLFDEISAIDRLGVIKTSGISHDGVNGSGVVTLPGSGHTLQTGEAIAAGDFITLGINSTTHSQIVEDAEDYLKNYAMWRVFKRDSSSDSAEQKATANQMALDIITNFADPTEDINEIPITDWSYHPDC